MFTRFGALMLLSAAAVNASPLCYAEHQEMVGTDVKQVTVNTENGTDDELDAACCSSCSSLKTCEYWVRGPASGTSATCWLKKDFVRHEASTTRWGSFKETIPWGAQGAGSHTPSPPLGKRSVTRVRATPVGTVNWSVNFYDAVGDNVMHFNPRPWAENNHVIINSKVGGSWQTHETVSAAYPFTPGAMAWILFEQHDDHFKIFVNGDYYTSYNYRWDFGTITSVEVGGDWTIWGVDFLDGSTQSPTSAPTTAAPTTAEYAAQVTLEASLGDNGHDTAFDATTGNFYVCSSATQCLVNARGSRGQSSLVARSSLPGTAVFDNYSKIESADGLGDGDITIDLAGWTFTSDAGTQTFFPWSCVCGA